MTRRLHWRRPLDARTAILSLGVLHLLFSLFVNTPGYLTYDSGTYHFMARTFATTGQFFVWNGFEEFPSPELATAQLRIHSGRLVAQYPELFSILAFPFYITLGYPGLFLINALAFLGINALVYKLALLLFQHSETALMSMVVYSLGSFAWEYSQSSYPHLSSTFFVLLAVYLTALAMAEPTWLRLPQASGAGLALGMAVGLRLDSFFAFPAVVLPFLFARPAQLRETLAAFAGLTPPFLALSWINHQKFGTYMPLSYGTTGRAYHADLGWYLPVTLLGLAVLAAAFAWSRLQGRYRSSVGVSVGLLSLLVISLRADLALDFATRMLGGAYQILVDLRIRDPTLTEPALTRTANGAMVYLGSAKKALLQSCPYLVILIYTFYDALRRRENHQQVLFLLIAPASFIGFFSYLAWHGSIALNMRYLNPILPMTSILAAYAWVGLAERTPRSAAIRCFVYSLLLLFFLSVLISGSLDFEEPIFLTAPLLLAALIGVFELCRRQGWLPALSRRGVGYLMLVGFAWAGAVTLGNDYPVMAAHRKHHLVESERLLPYIENDSLIMSTIPDTCWGLIEKREKLRIANPDDDKYRSFAQLASFHLAAGRRVYLAYPPDGFGRDLQNGRFSPFWIRQIAVWPKLVLYELLEPGSLPLRSG